jgi:hypothetical protein
MTNLENAQKIGSVFKVDIKIHFNPLIYKISSFLLFLSPCSLKREIFTGFWFKKRKSSFSHISTTKLIDIGVHGFRLMKGVEW